MFTTCLLPPLLSASGNSRVYFPVWAGAALAPLSLWVLRSEWVRNFALMALLVTASFQTYTNLKGLEMRMERSERLVVPDSQEAYLALIAARDYLDADQKESLRIGGVILNGVSPLGLRGLGVLRLHQKFSSAFGIARSGHLGLDPRLSWSRENIALLDVSDLREKIGIALDKYLDGVDLFILPVAETWPESVKPTRQAIYQFLPYITQYLSERDNVVEMGIQFHHRKITWVIYVVSKSS